jgi:hypothetical protein
MDRGAMLVSGGAAMVALGVAACLIAFPDAPTPDLGEPIVTTVAEPDSGVAVVDVAAPAAEPAEEPDDTPAPGGAEVVTPALPTAADGTTAALPDGYRDGRTGDGYRDGWTGDGYRDGWTGDGGRTPDGGYREATGDGWVSDRDPGSRDGSGWGDHDGGDRDDGRTGW